MASVGADQIRDTFFDLLARYGVLAFLYEVIMTGFSTSISFMLSRNVESLE